jgi:hypothetical protein
MNQPDRCVDTQIHDVLPQREKKKLNMQYISFMYKEFRPILLSGLKIQNAFKTAKMGMYMSVINWLEILRDFRQWRILENDAVWNVYNLFFHSKERMHEIEVWVRSREQKGLATHPDSGPEQKLYSKTTSLH